MSNRGPRTLRNIGPSSGVTAPFTTCILATVAAVVLCLAWSRSASAHFTTVINIPPDPAPTFIDSDTQLNVLDGGGLPSDSFSPFQAGLSDRSSSNVEVNISGGIVGQSFHANSGSRVNISGGLVHDSFHANTGSVVNISGGMVGGRFEAFTGSDVAISGGTVGRYFDANSGSRVTISGGTVGEFFDANPDSRVAISGGTVRSRFKAFPDSEVTISGGTVGAGFRVFDGKVIISGGEFLLNGVATARTTVTLTGSDLLTGTLEDGSPFIFSRMAFDKLSDTALARASLPPLDTTPIHVDNSNAPNGLRQGQSLTLHEGGVLGENFAAVNATLNINDGEVGDGLEVVGTKVTISGGTVGDDFRAFTGSDVTLTGGTIGRDFRAHSDSEVTILSGTVGSHFEARSASHVTISGGTVGYLHALSGSEVTIADGNVGDDSIAFPGSRVAMTGGIMGDSFYANPRSEVTISGGALGSGFTAFGTINLLGVEFLLDGLPIAGHSNPGDSLVLNARGGQLLTGALADGSPFDFVLNGELVDGEDFFHPDAVLRLTLVPEPDYKWHAIGLCLVVAVLVRTAGRRQAAAITISAVGERQGLRRVVCRTTDD